MQSRKHSEPKHCQGLPADMLVRECCLSLQNMKELLFTLDPSLN